MARRKKRRVPQVLWRLYRNRARTLAETILSLLHSPPPVGPVDCRCGGWRCLGCCGDNAFSFLVRSDDGTDYRRLLNHSFVVVPDNSPPFSGFDHHNRWSQLEVSLPLDFCRSSYVNFNCLINFGWKSLGYREFILFSYSKRYKMSFFTTICTLSKKQGGG